MYRRGRYWHCDLRPWGGGRTVLRDPKAKGWPKRGTKTEDEDIARRWAWRYVDLHRAGTRREHLGLPGPGTPIEQAGRDWLDASEHSVAVKTWEARKLWSRLLAEKFPNTAMEDVDTTELQAWFNAMLRQGYKASTLHTAKNVLSAFFRDQADHNPVRDIELPPIPDQDARPWTDGEVRRIREACESDIEVRSVEFALASGGRQGELFGARWADIDRKNKAVRFQRQIDRTGKHFRGLKGKRNRTALLLPNWWDHDAPDAEGLILPDAEGSPYSARTSYDIVAGIMDRAGVNERGAGWHRFRHRYAKDFLDLTRGSIELLQYSLGHASVRTTQKAYGHLRADRAADLARGLIYGDD